MFIPIMIRGVCAAHREAFLAPLLSSGQSQLTRRGLRCRRWFRSAQRLSSRACRDWVAVQKQRLPSSGRGCSRNAGELLACRLDLIGNQCGHVPRNNSNRRTCSALAGRGMEILFRSCIGCDQIGVWRFVEESFAAPQASPGPHSR